MGLFNNFFGKPKNAEEQAEIALRYAAKGDKEKADYWYGQAASQGNSEGLKNIADNKKDLLLRRKLKPENETVDEWAEKNDKLYCEAEEIYYSALNTAETDVRYSVVCSSLANFYELFSDVYPDIEKAAYFYYEAYLSGGNNFALERFRGIREKYQLDVDISDMDKWAKKLQLKGE